MKKGFVILVVFQLYNYVKDLEEPDFCKVLGASVGDGSVF